MCKYDGTCDKRLNRKKGTQQDKLAKHSNNKKGTEKTRMLYVMALQGMELLRIPSYTSKIGRLLMHFWRRGRSFVSTFPPFFRSLALAGQNIIQNVLYVMVLQGVELLRIASYTAKAYPLNRHGPKKEGCKGIRGRTEIQVLPPAGKAVVSRARCELLLKMTLCLARTIRIDANDDHALCTFSRAQRVN